MTVKKKKIELCEEKIRLPIALADQVDLLAEGCGLTGDQMLSAILILHFRQVGWLSLAAPAKEPKPNARDKK
jgi:hypothetical protein